MVPPVERILIKCGLAVLVYFVYRGFFRELAGRFRREKE